jgi:octopine/nopaline transport system permease protein
MEPAFILESFRQMLPGLPLTLQLAFVSVASGLVLAVLLAVVLVYAPRPLAWVAAAYVFVFRGTPLLVQLFLIYYGLGQFRPALQELGVWWFFRDPVYCVITALALNTAAYGAEIVRGGLQAVAPQQIEAGRAFGMSGFRLFRRILVPQALRQALPSYGNELIIMVKATSLASTVTLMEVTGIAQKLISQTFRAVEVFIAAGVIYLVLNFLIARLVALAERAAAPDRAPMRQASGGKALATTH